MLLLTSQYVLSLAQPIFPPETCKPQSFLLKPMYALFHKESQIKEAWNDEGVGSMTISNSA